MFLLEALISEGFAPNVIRKGRHIKLIAIEEIQLRILSSGSYFCGNEFDIARMFDIAFDTYFFPYNFFCSENIRYDGRLPSLDFFTCIFDTKKIRENKIAFWQNWNNKRWCLVKELKIYAELKLTLLSLGVIKFINESFNFQNKLQRTSLDFTYCHPFSTPLVSFGGFIYSLFRRLFLNNHDIRIVKHEYGFPIRKSSLQEYEWASYYCYLYPEKNYRHAFNHPEGCKYFRESVPDLYSEQFKEALYYNGCWAHSHMENCVLNPSANENSVNAWGKTFKEVNDSFWAKLHNLMLNNEKHIETVTVEWECQFKKKRKTDAFCHFQKTVLLQHPLVRLTSRDCFRGAYFDVCAYKWSSDAFPNEQLFFVDVNGLYSFCAIQNQFMIGPYKVIIGNDLSHVKIQNQEFYYFDQKICGGAILVTILPPSDLKHPFLLYKTRTGKTVLTLCKLCSETNTTTCSHTEVERSLTGSYMLSEIAYSLSLNYKIVAIYEIHAYFKSEFIFREFVECLDYLKLINSVDQACNQLLLDLNQNQKYFKFAPNDFKRNDFKRTMYKLASNSLFGKIAQKNDHSQTIYVSSQEEIENIFFSPNQILDIYCLNENVCQVNVKPNIKQMRPSRKTNCYIGAQVTSYARQKIHQDIQMLVNSTTATLYYVDCDSLIFALPKNEKNPLPMSMKCGDYKHEVMNITNFLTLGPKVYFLSYLQKEQPIKICKIRGLSLDFPFINQVKFDETLFELYLSNYVLSKRMAFKVPQSRSYADFKHFKNFRQTKELTFRNHLNPSRIIIQNKRCMTLPYGFKDQ